MHLRLLAKISIDFDNNSSNDDIKMKLGVTDEMIEELRGHYIQKRAMIKSKIEARKLVRRKWTYVNPKKFKGKYVNKPYALDVINLAEIKKGAKIGFLNPVMGGTTSGKSSVMLDAMVKAGLI
jgi:hypothetical protein